MLVSKLIEVHELAALGLTGFVAACPDFQSAEIGGAAGGGKGDAAVGGFRGPWSEPLPVSFRAGANGGIDDFSVQAEGE